MTESATLTTRTLSVSIVKDSGHYRVRVVDVGNGRVVYDSLPSCVILVSDIQRKHTSDESVSYGLLNFRFLHGDACESRHLADVQDTPPDTE